MNNLYNELLEMPIYENTIEERNSRIFINNILFEESFEISAKEISKLTNNIDIITESQIESILETSNAKFQKFGIDSSKANSAIKKYGTEIGKTIKEEGITKTSKSKIADLFDKLYKEIEELTEDTLGIDFTDSDKKKLEKYDPNNIKKAVILVLEVVIANTLCAIVLSIVFGPQLGNFLLGILVAPITEETAKAISIKNKFTAEFAVVFNIYEASGYILKATVFGVPFVNALRARLLAVGFHLSTTIIQWLANNQKVQQKLGIKEDDVEGKKKIRFIGQLIGMIMHFCWNFAAFKSVNFNKALLGMDDINM